MAGDHTLTLDENNFEDEVIKSDVPVLVDFWAQWCGPCLMVAPTIDELAADFEGKAKIGKVDVDKAGALASKYSIQNIPTVLVFDGGEEVERIIGAKHKSDYEAILNARLK